MAKTLRESESGKYYLGKVRLVGQKEIRVSLFTPEGEIVGDFARNYFPETPKAGDIFTYTAINKRNVKIKMVQPRDLSESEIRSLEAEVARTIPSGEF